MDESDNDNEEDETEFYFDQLIDFNNDERLLEDQMEEQCIGKPDLDQNVPLVLEAHVKI